MGEVAYYNLGTINGVAVSGTINWIMNMHDFWVNTFMGIPLIKYYYEGGEEDDYKIWQPDNDKLISVDDVDAEKYGELLGPDKKELKRFNYILIHFYLPNRAIFIGGLYMAQDGKVDIVERISIVNPGNAMDWSSLSIERSRASATSNGSYDRAVVGGGVIGGVGVNDPTNSIEYIAISIPGDAVDFGDLIMERYWLAACSNGINNRGVFAGGYGDSDEPVAGWNGIDYITISSTGNATVFGEMMSETHSHCGFSNGTSSRGVFAGGSMGFISNAITYITISSTGDATDFGDLAIKRHICRGGTSNGTNNRGVIGGGVTGPGTNLNAIDYITITSTGNATDFGDLTQARSNLTACSNGTNDRGVWGGGVAGAAFSNRIDYITISTTGNATDFGDLTLARRQLDAVGNT